MTNASVNGTSLECLKEWAGLQGSILDPLPESSSGNLMRLSRTIEGEIIPRLLMLLKSEVVETGVGTECRTDNPAPFSIDELVQLLLRHDAAVATRYVTALRSAGMSLPSIYLDLLAPAARMLGAMWDEDRCSFADVTVAVSRMHQVLLHFSPCFCANVAESTENAHRALIVPVPGEQHTFGLFMVVEFFRRAGWNIWSGSPATPSDLFGVVSANAFELLGYSVAADRHLGQLKEQLSAIRKRSRNPNIKILVGGQAFSDDPELFREVGADASAADGMQAVQVAERLVQRT